MPYRLFTALLAVSITTFLLGPLASSAFAAPPEPPTEDVSPTQGPERLDALLEAGRYDELATLTGNEVLKRRLSELRRARFMQQRLHVQYQPRHPVRDAIDDRVRLLEGEVARVAGVAVENAGSESTEANGGLDALTRARQQLLLKNAAAKTAQSGVSQGDSASVVGAGAGAL